MLLLALVLTAMTAVVLGTVVAPLLSATRAAPERADFDRAVYLDQLRELERDAARGLLGPAEAATARLEIERRLLASSRAAAGIAPLRGRATPWVAGGLAAFVTLGAVGLYLWLGAPGVPDQPFAQRSDERAQVAAAADLATSATTLQKKLAAHPDDTDGWLLYARTLAALGQLDQSADAYRHAFTLTKGRPDVATAYGETLVAAAQGIVTPAAHDTFAAALAKDPGNDVARYYLALADAQAGRVPAAIAAWQKLAAEVPEGAPVRAQLKQQIDQAATSAGMTPPPLAASAAAPAGPSAGDMAQMAKLSPDRRQAMIHSMVDKLAAELKSRPDDLPGWLRLARAYGVLGEAEPAAAAYEHAATLAPKDGQIPLDEAEALLQGHDLHDPIPDRVVNLLHRAQTLSPDEPAALWYLGLVAAQGHHPDQATAYWQRLLAKLPSDSPDRKMVAAALDAIKGK